MTDDAELLRRLRDGGPPPPPASRALQESLDGMKPVKTRVPLRTLLVVLAAGCVYPVIVRGSPFGSVSLVSTLTLTEFVPN